MPDVFVHPCIFLRRKYSMFHYITATIASRVDLPTPLHDMRHQTWKLRCYYVGKNSGMTPEEYGVLVARQDLNGGMTANDKTNGSNLGCDKLLE